MFHFIPLINRFLTAHANRMRCMHEEMPSTEYLVDNPRSQYYLKPSLLRHVPVILWPSFALIQSQFPFGARAQKPGCKDKLLSEFL